MTNIQNIIIKSIQGEVSEEEYETLFKWLDESEENKKTYARIRDIIALNGALISVQEQNERIKQRHNYKKVKIISVVAAIILGVMLPRWLALNSEISSNEVKNETLLISNNSTYNLKEKLSMTEIEKIIKVGSRKDSIAKPTINKIIVPRGKTFELELSDGTKVTLNSMTEFTFPSEFKKDIREVSLSGEAIFNVTRNEHSPFIVTTKQSRIEVLGTYFNVEAYAESNEERVSLLSGSVKTRRGEYEQLLKLGQQTVISKEKTGIDVTVFNSDEITAWCDDMFLFDDKPLEYIISRIEKWYDVDFEFTYENLKNMNAYVKIKRTKSLDELLVAISSTNKIRFEKQNGKIYLIPQI